MQQPWKPIAAGILAIVSGGLNLLVAVAVMLFMFVPSTHIGLLNPVSLSVPFIGLGAVAIAGGIFALQRRRWAFALAGAICAAISPWALLGIIAAIFVALSRDEFTGTSPSGPATPSV